MFSRTIIGFDPALKCTGWGVIRQTGNKLEFVDCGVIQTPADLDFPLRLKFLFENVLEVLKRFTPDEAAVEETFVNQSARNSLRLVQARGCIVLAPAFLDIPVSEYAPNLIKKSVVGAGHAQKDQIKAMVKILLPKSSFKYDDEADALAIAICHAHHSPMKKNP